ncbi:hypothetical protein Wildcat_148 [Mycobacterium phage Wildcat]|uniref:Uncharacterized protein n=3 Tax=Mycobacterium virus Wildcat TaxID=1993859 RepID=Q19XT6_9CAUD|nr:hypothetical protein Wildcat_148 [Mycobacterium phage Wildcat]ABE67728.1 hypothetical protein Wildcat_148 [Mycobacterium phage Wildcat]AQT25790.2 hypothetical protein EniyanLRS_141 [Mycobacterium phage EniyanLRS]
MSLVVPHAISGGVLPNLLRGNRLERNGEMSAAQDIILNALMDAVHEKVDQGKIDPEVFEHEPQSHVFYPEPGEYWDEDDVAAIKAVGESDVQAKINYYISIINQAEKGN